MRPAHHRHEKGGGVKAVRIKMTGSDGLSCFWTVRRFQRSWNCGGNLKTAKLISGWSFTDHEGCERCLEGDWFALVDMFCLVATNYGLKTNIS